MGSFFCAITQMLKWQKYILVWPHKPHMHVTLPCMSAWRACWPGLSLQESVPYTTTLARARSTLCFGTLIHLRLDAKTSSTGAVRATKIGFWHAKSVNRSVLRSPVGGACVQHRLFHPEQKSISVMSVLKLLSPFDYHYFL